MGRGSWDSKTRKTAKMRLYQKASKLKEGRHKVVARGGQGIRKRKKLGGSEIRYVIRKESKSLSSNVTHGAEGVLRGKLGKRLITREKPCKNRSKRRRKERCNKKGGRSHTDAIGKMQRRCFCRDEKTGSIWVGHKKAWR